MLGASFFSRLVAFYASLLLSSVFSLLLIPLLVFLLLASLPGGTSASCIFGLCRTLRAAADPPDH